MHFGYLVESNRSENGESGPGISNVEYLEQKITIIIISWGEFGIYRN